MCYLLPIGTTGTPAGGPTPGPQELGAAIRAARQAHGLTQLDLADAIGVHRRVVGELERGKPTVRLGIALAAAAAVGLSVQVEPRT